MQIYAFGSLVRGEVDQSSDIDLLAVVTSVNPGLSPEKFSIYSQRRLRELWVTGNPFAWHLHLEAVQMFSQKSENFLESLGPPNPYVNVARDCDKFRSLFQSAESELQSGTYSTEFELSNVFLAVRNFATCFALGYLRKPIFNRDSSQRLNENSLQINQRAFEVFERARILSTRGYGEKITQAELETAKLELPLISKWMDSLANKLEI